MSVSRRDFLGAGAAAAAGLALPKLVERDAGRSPFAIGPSSSRRRRRSPGAPVIISAANGFRSKDQRQSGHPEGATT